MTTREELIDCALGYIDTPFRMNGRSRRGLDCIGIGFVIARDLKVTGWRELWADPECHEYGTVRPRNFMRAKLDGFVKRGLMRAVSVPDLQAADLVLRWVGFNDHHVSLIYYDDWIIEGSNQPEPRWPHGRVRKIRVLPDLRASSFLGGYQFAEVF